MKPLIALLAGLVFGLGLIISGMGNPAKVQNFLDLFGAWDPSLAFVMAGAIAVGLLAFTWAKKRKTALLGDPMQLPASRTIDAPLLTGAALFGTGQQRGVDRARGGQLHGVAEQGGLALFGPGEG